MNKVWPVVACLAMLLMAVTILTTNMADAQTGWEYRRAITIDHTRVGADLADFPVLISLSGEWLRYQPEGNPGHIRQPDGGDVRFTTSSQIQLDHEIEAYDGAAGTLVAWVRVPLLSSSTDTQLYMWYGNAGCEDQWNPEEVWDDHFTMVHHLAETTGTHHDSTANTHDGTPLGGIVQDAIGQVDGADEFDGIDARVECGTGRMSWSHQDVGYQRAVIKDGKVYVVGGGDHSLPSFHAYGFIFDLETGDLLLQSPSLGENTFTASETGPVIDGDTVYACPTKGNISAWNTINNTLVWTTTNLSIWSSRIEFDGTYLYATTTDYQVVKIDTSNQGLVTASFNLDPDTDNENAVAPYLDEQEGAVYALGASKLYKLSASNLSEIWNRDIGSGCLDSGLGHSRMVPIVVNDQYTGNEPWVIAGCWGNDIFYAYDSAGNLEWTRPITEGVRAIASYHPGNGLVYIPSQGDKIYALDVVDGSVQFVVDGSDVPAGSGFGSPCTIVDDYLVFKTTSGTTQYLYLFDAATGDYVTRYTLGTNLFLTCFPVAASQGYLVTGGSLINYGGGDGGIFAVKAGDGEAVDYYPLHGPYRFGYIENALTDLGNDLNPVDQITLEAWANIDELTTDMNDHLLCRRDTYCLKFAQMPADVPRMQLYDATAGWYNLDLTRTLTQSTWYHLAGTWDGSEIQLYINGSLEASLDYTGTVNTTDYSTFIGSYDGNPTPPNQSPDGRIDEVRMSNAARSAEWIAAAYSNQSAPSSFYTVGPEQQPGIEIAKLPDRQVVTSSSDAMFTILISNTGALDLEDLTVSDALTPDCDRTLASLAAGASLSYTCTATSVTADFENSVTVTGTAVGGTEVESTDIAFIDVLPDFVLSKTAEPLEIVEPGGPVTFTINLTNTCAEPITLTALVDSIYGDLTGQGDCVLPQGVEPGADYVCAFTATVSGPGGYVEIDEVTAGCIDDENNLVEASDRATVTIKAVPDVLVIPTSLTVSEPDGADTFLLTLTSQPTATVSIPLTATTGECTVWPAMATLDAGNWSTGVTATVTAVDDDLIDGPQACPVETGLTLSADGNYQGLKPEDVAVTVEDDDEPGVVVTPTALTISEPDGSDTFLLTLISQPTATVSIPLTATTGECTVWPAMATLDAGNWRTGVTATVTAVDDDLIDGPQACPVETGLTLSADGNYQGLDPEDVAVTVEDDDEPGVVVTPTHLTISEPDGADTFLLTLTSQPTATVSIPLTATTGECTVWPATAMLDAGNWSTGVTATVTAVDDDIDDGPQACLVETGRSQSDDPNYYHINPLDVDITVENDDEAGVVVTPTILTINEPDSSDTFVISLTSEPTETVFIALSLSNDECDVSPRSVVLAAGNWHAGATVTVTAQDDDLHDGSQICVVHTGPAHSAAPQYEGIEVDDITVTVQDDETIWHFYLPLVVRAWPPVPGVPVLHPISNSGGLGTYSITWDSAIRAETYVLEQAMTSSFDMSWQIYAGPATNHLASGQGAARYYYRVKARNSWGDSGWSHVEQVDVLWEAEPNDNGLTQANGPILSGLIYYGTFPDADDLQDYFYFDLSTPHSVELALSNIAGGENYNLVLRDASLENVVGYSALPGNANEYISIPELPAGRYYIQVYNFSQVGSDQPYHLHVVYE